MAEQVLDKSIELEETKEHRQELVATSAESSGEAREFNKTLNALAQRAMTIAEQISITASEIPGEETEAANADDIARKLLAERGPDSHGPDLDDILAITGILDHLHQHATSMQVNRVSIRTADGLLEDVKLLSAGHIAFAYETSDDGRVGFALSSPADASGYRWTESLGRPTANELRAFMNAIETRETDIVSVPVDVTQRLSIETVLNRRSLAEQLVAGGPVMFPLAALAVLALAIIIERSWSLFFRNPGNEKLVREVLESCGNNRCAEAEALLSSGRNSVVTRTLSACLRNRSNGIRAMEDSVQEQLLHELPRLRRFLTGLTILAAVAPLLGLLGTVTGIIRTFGVIRAFGNSNPGLMAGGISEALITTATGLIIAIPILLTRGVLRGRMDKITSSAEKHAASLLNMLSRRG